MKKISMFLIMATAGMCFALSDSPDTVALWHFDSTYTSGSSTYTPDDDSVVVGRNYDLELRNGAVLSTTPGFDGTGYALELDGVNDFGLKLWGQYDNVKIQLSFKADTLPAANKYFVEIASIVRLYLNASNQLVMTVWDDQGVATTKNVTAAVSAGVWYSLEASYDSDGLFTLLLFDASGTQVDAKTGIYGSGTLAKTGTPAFVVGSYRGTQYYFDGQIDEMKVSNYQFPDWAEPFVDKAGIVSALWHFNAFADPNLSGSTYEIMPDDDSDNMGRDADLALYSGLTTQVAAGSGNGPTLVNPNTEGIGYPADNADFGKCAYFDDPILVEGDSFRLPTSKVNVDPTNVRIDLWMRPADDMIELTPESNQQYLLVDRWGQLYVMLTQTPDDFVISAMSFGDDGLNVPVEASYSSLGIDPANWVNISYQFYQGQAELYINGGLVASATLATTSLNAVPAKPDTYIGKRYNNYALYFWGYMDEIRVTQTVEIAPEWIAPYIDKAGVVSALYHFDTLADPNVTGLTYELLPDDDSDNPGRDADMMLYSGASTRVDVGVDAGPTLVDPDAEGIGYPRGDAAFGKCAFFDDPVLVEADSFRNTISAITFDPSNISIECWVRPADDLLAINDGVLHAYYIFDRWGAMDLRFMQLADGSFQLQAMAWDDNAAVTYLTADYTTLGLNPANWVHVKFTNFQGDANLYINGSLVQNVTLATASLDISVRANNIIGSRYNPKEWFWGYLDEMRISQAVEALECGVWGYLPGDFDFDCVVGESDLNLLAAQWLMTTDPTDSAAVEGTFTQYDTYNIPMAVSVPTIDGTLAAGEWSDAKEIYLAMPELTTAPNVGSFKYEEPTHADFSGYYYMKWDATNLYVGIKIIDDALIFDAGYPDDHATLAFNLLNAAGAGQADVAFYNMYRDYFGASQVVNATGFNAAFNPVNAVIASGVQADGWSFEAAYKWSDFNGYTPTVGDQQGIAIMICDNDVADGLRDTFLFDSGSGDTTVLTTPALYRVATLTSGIACGDTGYLSDDINQDCDVNLLDYAVMADNWLGCSTPNAEGCVDAR